VISHSFAFSASRRLKFSYKSSLPCSAFPSTLVSMLELSPPLPVLLLLRVGLSSLNTRALLFSGVTQYLTEMIARSKHIVFLGSRARPMCRADSLFAICEANCLDNLVSLTSYNPVHVGLHGLLRG
jgi:hypothetical protein